MVGWEESPQTSPLEKTLSVQKGSWNMRKYSNATAFRMALEERLKNIAKEEDLDIQRLSVVSNTFVGSF